MDDIAGVGVRMGLRDLSVQAVATELGVTPTALYRYVDGKFGLETVVGERILADLQIVDEPGHDAAEHLLSSAQQLRAFLLQHPGLPAYVQLLFPRGPTGEQLLAGEVAALLRRGCGLEAAMMATTTVALIVISVAAAEENRRDHAARIPEMEQRRRAALQAYVDHGLSDPGMDADAYFSYVIGSCLNGILQTSGIQNDEHR